LKANQVSDEPGQWQHLKVDPKNDESGPERHQSYNIEDLSNDKNYEIDLAVENDFGITRSATIPIVSPIHYFIFVIYLFSGPKSSHLSHLQVLFNKYLFNGCLVFLLSFAFLSLPFFVYLLVLLFFGVVALNSPQMVDDMNEQNFVKSMDFSGTKFIANNHSFIHCFCFYCLY